MLEKTSTPSVGQPVPVMGGQKGEENGRSPTNVMPLAPTTVPPGMNTPLPPGAPLYGKCRPCGAIVVPAGTKNEESAKNGPHVPAPRVAFKSRQVCALPKLR